MGAIDLKHTPGGVPLIDRIAKRLLDEPHQPVMRRQAGEEHGSHCGRKANPDQLSLDGASLTRHPAITACPLVTTFGTPCWTNSAASAQHSSMDGSLGINLHLCIVASACPFVGLASAHRLARIPLKR